MFDAILSCPLRKRAAGTLHDKYEIYAALHRFGGGDTLFSLFNAILAGQVGEGITDMLTSLRAVVLYKDAERTRVRPIGIGETLRRLVGRCVAKQERELWARFCTSRLPEDEAETCAGIEEAEAAAEMAEDELKLASGAREEAQAARLSAAAGSAAEARCVRAAQDRDEALARSSG